MSEHRVKIKLRLLYDLLEKHSDEEHPVSTEEVVGLLAAEGVTVSNKVLHNDILLLNESGYNVQFFKKKSYYYYVAERAFDIPELKIIIDAVQAANFITENKTLALIDKIAALAGEHKAELLKRNIVCFDTNKHSNKYIFYNIDALITAIEEKKKSSFVYYDFDMTKNKVYRKNGERYIVNPLALIYTNDKYYLVCYSDKYKNLSNYRIDRMEKVEVESAEIMPVKEYENFNIHAYKRQEFAMFAGESKEVELTADKTCVDTVLDRFGEQTILHKVSDDTFSFKVKVQVSQAFYAWCLISCGRIRIAAPTEVVNGMDEYIKTVLP
jgi:predicted DNA-binding transcriptional regulator YafY